MQKKSQLVVTNTLLTFAAWIGTGVFVWHILCYADPAGGLTDEALATLSSNLRTLASTVAQIAATMAGFILAAVALLLSLSDRELIKRMSISGHLHVLLLRMKLAMLLCLVLTLGGIAYIIIPDLGKVHLYSAAAALTSVAISVFDILWKLIMVFFFISPLTKEEPKADRTLYGENSAGDL